MNKQMFAALAAVVNMLMAAFACFYAPYLYFIALDTDRATYWATCCILFWLIGRDAGKEAFGDE
jgi:hypothetical protein